MSQGVAAPGAVVGSSSSSPAVTIYRTALADTCERLVDSFGTLVRLAAVGSGLDPGEDESLGVEAAAAGIAAAAEALARATGELRVRAALREEAEVNREVERARTEYRAARGRVEKTCERVRGECKAAIAEIMSEISST